MGGPHTALKQNLTLTLCFPSADPKIFCPIKRPTALICITLPYLSRKATMPVSKPIRNDLSISIDL